MCQRCRPTERGVGNARLPGKSLSPCGQPSAPTRLPVAPSQKPPAPANCAPRAAQLSRSFQRLGTETAPWAAGSSSAASLGRGCVAVSMVARASSATHALGTSRLSLPWLCTPFAFPASFPAPALQARSAHGTPAC